MAQDLKLVIRENHQLLEAELKGLGEMLNILEQAGIRVTAKEKGSQ